MERGVPFPQAAAKFPDEIPFIQTVGRFMQRVGRGGEVNGRTDGNDRAKLWRRIRSPLPRCFQDKVAPMEKPTRENLVTPSFSITLRATAATSPDKLEL